MKTQRLVFLGVIILGFVIGLNLLYAHSDADPVLVFKGYSPSATNTTQVAQFELRNMRSRAIWLYYSGREFPLGAPLLERPVAVPARREDTQQTNVYSLSAGSFFMHGDKLLPRQSLLLEFPLSSGKPASQVGIYFYVGRFKDGNDFLGYLGTPGLDSNASLKDRGAFYWEKAKRRFRAPKRCEVWCPQPVCFQEDTSHTPTVHPPESMGGEG
jgi:hypothetical protein